MANMNIPFNGPYDDKENFSPSPTKTLYPRLPQPPASPSKRHSPGTSEAYSPLLSYDQAKRPGQTPNTSRKRRALATLINSPPRPSYADKVRGIFREPVPKLHRWDGFGKRIPSITIPNTSRVRKEATPWSPLESGSEGRVRRNASRVSVGSESTSAGSRDASKSAESLIGRSPQFSEQVQTPATSSMLQGSPGNPLRDPEEACQLPPAFVPASHRHHNIPEIQEPPPTFDESSDSWTGDDEFLPRSAGRQKRIDRKLNESPAHLPLASSTQLLRPQAPAYTSQSYPWPTALSKPSRFRAATPLSLYPELPKSLAPSAADHRASDADDEDSNSP